MLNFKNPKKAKILDWIIRYLVEEDFPCEHLDALSKIVGLFNECEESESEVFAFSKQLYNDYAA